MSFEKNFGVDVEATTVKKIIDEMFTQDVRIVEENNPYEGLHAGHMLAGFSGKWRLCYRQLVLNKYYLHIPIAMSVDRMRINKMGWYVHIMIQRLFKQSGRAIEVEVTRIDEKWGVFHTPDIIARFEELFEKQHVIIEIKSMNKESYLKAVTKFPFDARKAHEHAFKQAQLYMYLTNTKKAIFLAFCKDNSDHHEWIFDFDQEYIAPYVARLDNLLVFYEKFEQHQGKMLPQRVCENPDEPRAKSCPMRHVCWLKTYEERKPHLRIHEIKKDQKNSSLIHEDYDNEIIELTPWQ